MCVLNSKSVLSALPVLALLLGASVAQAATRIECGANYYTGIGGMMKGNVFKEGRSTAFPLYDGNGHSRMEDGGITTTITVHNHVAKIVVQSNDPSAEPLVVRQKLNSSEDLLLAPIKTNEKDQFGRTLFYIVACGLRQ